MSSDRQNISDIISYSANNESPGGSQLVTSPLIVPGNNTYRPGDAIICMLISFFFVIANFRYDLCSWCFFSFFSFYFFSLNICVCHLLFLLIIIVKKT